VVGFGAALDYFAEIGPETVAAYEHELLDYATAALAAFPGVRLIGTARERAGALSFVLEGVHPHDVGTILDGEGIAIRTGHHCAQPVMQRFGVPATVRASLALYNTREEIDALVAGLHKVKEVFG
jgi:cysteine desulfurase/selenocysteine lyase